MKFLKTRYSALSDSGVMMCYFVKSVLVFGIVGFLFCASASAIQKEENSDLINRISPIREHDFKIVAAGQKAVHDFEIKNVTSAPLNIQSVQSSCGCAAPMLTRRKIEVGETLKLPVQLDTLRFQGKRSASITVEFVNKQVPEIQFQCTADIKNFSLSKDKILLSPKSQESEIQLTRVGNSFWKIRSAKATDPRIAVSVNRLQRKPKIVSFSLKCEWVSDEPIPNGKAFVYIETNDSKRRRIEVSVLLKESDAIETAPKKVRIGVSGKPEMVVIKTSEPTEIENIEFDTSKIRIAISGDENRGDRKIHVLGVSCLKPIESGIQLEAIVRFKNEQFAVLKIVMKGKNDD